MQAINVLAVACHAHQRTVACAHAVQRDFAFRLIAVQRILLDDRICREQGVTQSVKHLERTIHGAHNQELFAILFRIVHKHSSTHGRGKANVARECSTVDASVVNTDGHTDLLRTKIHHAIAHERIRGLFGTGALRDIHRNLDSGIATLGRHGVCITGRTNRLDRIELLLGILSGLAQVRQQVCTRTVVVSIFAQRILERLTDAQDSVGFDHRNTELVIAQSIATPEVCNAVFQRLSQVPVIHAPDHNAARRDTCIVAADVDNNALRFFLVDLALFRTIYAILKNQVQAVYRHSLDCGIGTFASTA